MLGNSKKTEIIVSKDEKKLEVFEEKPKELVYAHQVKDPSFDMSLSHLLDVLLWVRTLQ
jgi:hypothetical protein